MSEKIKLETYIKAMSNSLPRHISSGFHYGDGINGLERLAKDIGFGLSTSPREEVDKIYGTLYGTLIAKPHIVTGKQIPEKFNNKEFLFLVRQSENSAREKYNN